MEVQWMPPPSPFVKINCNGSSLGNLGPTGFGVVLRSSDGGWIYGFSGSVSRADNLCVELLDLRKGLQLA